MSNRLLLALKCTLKETWRKNRYTCQHCPFGYSYQTSEDNWTCDDIKLFDDVYKYMANHTQHLLSKNQVRQKAREKAAIWFENIDIQNMQSGWKLIQGYPPFYNEIYFCDFNQHGRFLNMKTYGTKWRCWTEPLRR